MKNFSKTEIKQSENRQEVSGIDMTQVVEDAHNRAVDTMTVIRAALKDLSERNN
jgi:hypothetical protein